MSSKNTPNRLSEIPVSPFAAFTLSVTSAFSKLGASRSKTAFSGFPHPPSAMTVANIATPAIPIKRFFIIPPNEHVFYFLTCIVT